MIDVNPVDKWLDKAVAAAAQMADCDVAVAVADYNTFKRRANLYFRQAMKAEGHEYKENVI